MDTSTLRMALLGYEAERQKIQEKIDTIQSQLKGRLRSVVGTPATRARRGMSVAARKRIAAAQKKRWAEYRKKKKAA